MAVEGDEEKDGGKAEHVVDEAAEVAEARAVAGQDGEDLLAETSDGSDSDIEPSYI